MSAQLKQQPVYQPPRAVQRPVASRRYLPRPLVKAMACSAALIVLLSFVWLTGVGQVRAQRRERSRIAGQIRQSQRRAWQAYEAQKPLRDRLRIAEYAGEAGMVTFEGRPFIVERGGASW